MAQNLRYLTALIILLFTTNADASKNIPPQPPQKNYQINGLWELKSKIVKTCWITNPKTCFHIFKFPGYTSGTSVYASVKGSIHFSDNNKGTIISKSQITFYYHNGYVKGHETRYSRRSFKIIKRNNKTILITHIKNKYVKEFILEIKHHQLTLMQFYQNYCKNSNSGRWGYCNQYFILIYEK